jgi:hypothetical protein
VGGSHTNSCPDVIAISRPIDSNGPNAISIAQIPSTVEPGYPTNRAIARPSRTAAGAGRRARLVTRHPVWRECREHPDAATDRYADKVGIGEGAAGAPHPPRRTGEEAPVRLGRVLPIM